MKALPLLVLLAIVLSGCATDAPADGATSPATAPATPTATSSPTATATATPGGIGGSGQAGQPVVTLDEVPDPAPALLNARGTVAHAATVLVRVQDGNSTTEVAADIDDGTWQAQVEVPVGQSLLVVLADDGVARTEAPLRRLGEMTFEVRFRGDLRDDRVDVAPIDPDDHASAPRYEDCEVDHAGSFTVHDAMVQWQAATDVEVTYGACGPYGFSVEAIDGHQSPGFWCYAIDGAPAETGISSQTVAVGQTVTWDDCNIVLG